MKAVVVGAGAMAFLLIALAADTHAWGEPDQAQVDAVARLRQAADAAGRDPATLSITVFNAPADQAALAVYRKAGIHRVLPEAAAVVDREEPLAEILFADALGDAVREQSERGQIARIGAANDDEEVHQQVLASARVQESHRWASTSRATAEVGSCASTYGRL